MKHIMAIKKKYINDIGMLNRRIVLRKKNVITKNDYGHEVSATYTDKSIWACLSFGNKDEEELLDKQTVIEILYFVIWATTVSTSDQIVFNSKTYDIINIEEIGRRNYLKIKVRKVT